MLTETQIARRLRLNEATAAGQFANTVPMPINKDGSYPLCNELIEQVDIQDKSILVLFNLEFVLTLIEDRNVDPSFITLYAQSITKKNICDRLGVNYVTSMANTKFDVVFGNPPYDEQGTAKNEKLWAKFVKQTLMLNAEYIALITPNSMVSAKAVNGKKTRELIKSADYGFIAARDHIENPFKDVGVDTCHFILKHNSEDLINPIINNDIVEVPQVAIDIMNKLVSYEPKLKLVMGNTHINRNDTKEDSGNIIQFSGSKVSFTAKSVQGAGELKFVFPFSSSYHKMFVTEEAIGMLNMSIDINTHAEADQIMSFANSKLFNFVAKRWNKTSGFCPLVKRNMIPDLRRTTNWTDDELYAHFGLTDEEVAYVEQNS